jgi:GT2 family glycosyltransferase
MGAGVNVRSANSHVNTRRGQLPDCTGRSVRNTQSPPLVSILVVNFNGRKLLTECLASVRCQTYPRFEVILVDNGSTDGSVDLVRRDFPEVRIVALPTNRGFAGGCNAGIQAAAGDFIVTVNNDVRLDPTWLEEMVAAVRHRPGVGMVAAKMLFSRNPKVVDSTGICLDRAGMAWHLNGGSAHDSSEVEHDVFGPCAGAALYRRELFDDVGTFDEDFFCYLEDVDLAWRAQSAGWRCVYAPQARALHHHSSTAVEDSPFKRFHLGRNKVWLIAKNYPSPDIWYYLPIILLYDLVGVLAMVLFSANGSRSTEARLASVAGRLAGLAGLGMMLAKRKAARRRWRLPKWRIMSQMGGIPWPWSMYRRYAHLYWPTEFHHGASFDKGAAMK